MADKPLRPLGDEAFLLREFDDMTVGQIESVESFINYMDDFETWVEDNITAQAVTTLKAQVADLTTQLKEARDSAASQRSEREAQLQQSVAQLSQELSFMQIKLGGIQLILR